MSQLGNIATERLPFFNYNAHNAPESV